MFLRIGYYLERQGNGNLGLVKIGHIIHKAQDFTGMYEADGGAVAGGKDRSVAEAVKAGIGR